MAKIGFENPPPSLLDLCIENFNAWTWTTTEISYSELEKFLPCGNSSPKGLLSSQAGLFRIRWKNSTSKRCAVTAKVDVSLGYCGNKCHQLQITSLPDDILYIGKTQDMRERISRIFSYSHKSNSVARKILALLNEASSSSEKLNPAEDELNKIKQEIVFDFVQEEHPVKRDFMKAYAVAIEKPCLNIGLEH